jgi:5-methyltetrahydropteroyltriglutamate--homocysteine methyltransferase
VIEFKACIIGSYPKSLALGKTISRYRSGKISQDKLENAILKEEEKFFSIVKDVNPECTTDGLFRWDDIVDLTFSYINGQEKGELMRFFDNNFYYRKAVIKSKLTPKDEYKNILEVDREMMKKLGLKTGLSAVILGPLTYVELSQDEYYHNVEELLFTYSSVVNEVIKGIESKVDMIEIHEPSLFSKGIKKEILDKLSSAYESMLKGIRKTTLVISYFEVLNKRLPYLFSLPVENYGVDVIENKKKLANIYKYFKDKNVFLGVLNTRNTKMERISTIRRMIEKAKEKGAKEIMIGNASLMDFIPEEIAKKKLMLLKKVIQ